MHKHMLRNDESLDGSWSVGPDVADCGGVRADSLSADSKQRWPTRINRQHPGRAIVTYRYIRQPWLQAAQIATLTGTAIVGASIWVTPNSRDPKLSVIEHAMEANIWAVAMLSLSLIALVCELDMKIRKHDKWINIVSYCHILLCGLLVGYSSAALVGVLYRVWWNFGAPTTGMMMAFWHFLFVKRKPHD